MYERKNRFDSPKTYLDRLVDAVERKQINILDLNGRLREKVRERLIFVKNHNEKVKRLKKLERGS